jgi:hypothetical protein
MKFCFTLTIVCWTLVCLLLSRSQQAGLNHPLQVAGSGPWLDQCGEVASGSPTAAVLRSMEFDPVRAGPFASIGPPGQRPLTTAADRNLASCQTKATSSMQHPADVTPRNCWLNRQNLKIRVLQQPLASFS